MKKIAVSTLVNAKENYGQLLQAYALQIFLKKNGYDPMIIRYKRTFSLKDEKGIRKLAKYFYQKVDKIIPLKTKVNDEKQLSDQVLNRHKHFDSFYEDYFKTSDQQYFTIDELKKNPPEADVYIAGSDQIWNWENRYGYNPIWRE
jgi:RNase H-fold protein (predicted Holliday junction resolvase)